MCVQQPPERVGQSDAVYEVVSLQREAERSNEGRLASPTEEEEADEGMEALSSVTWRLSPLPLVNHAQHKLTIPHHIITSNANL